MEDAPQEISSDPSHNSKKQKVRGIWIALFAVAIVACAALITLAVVKMEQKKQHEREMDAALNTGKFYDGIIVQGVSLGGMTMDEAENAVKAVEATSESSYDITVMFGAQQWNFTQADISFTFDTDAVLEKAFAYARTGQDEDRYQMILDLKTTPVEYQITATADVDSLKPKIAEIVSDISQNPTEPTVTGFDEKTCTFSFQDGTAGYAADGDRLWADVKALASGTRSGSVAVQTNPVPFTMSLDELRARMKKLGTFQTVSTNNANGTYNMKKALLSADGTVIAAGATFSFFDTVGPCGAEDGYLEAGALLNGKHVDQYGGGICQASTTIYGAAIRSGLTITERSNHSLPSTYCKIGQDATVDYPYLDLKLTNNTDYPMYLVTETDNRKLIATFYGYQPSDYDSIEPVSTVTETIPALTAPVYTQDDALEKGTVQLEQSARDGYRVSVSLVYYKNGAAVRTEYLNSSYYPATAAYYSYGPGTYIPGVTGTPPEETPSSSASSSGSSSSVSSPAP